jgi:predicted ABC-type ATPase
LRRFAHNYAGGNHNLSEQKPALYIVAGPVGAGKSTFYEAHLKEAFPTLVPPLRHLQQPFLDERRSFAVEDIRVDTQLLDQAKTAGYSTTVLFISTEDAQLNVGRVMVRMSRGGQAVPVPSVIDSYRESTKNLPEVLKHTDELIVYDNTAHRRGLRVVAQFIDGILCKTAQTIPDWVTKIFGKELQATKQREKSGRGR